MSQVTSFGSSGSGTLVNTLTGNMGGPVGPIGGNINIVGDGVTFVTSGDPVTHTITASVITGAFVLSLSDDAGVPALPVAGDIQLVGGTNVTTTTVGNTIRFDSSPPILVPAYTNVNSTPYMVLVTDNYLSVDTTAAVTIRLPDAPPSLYQFWIIKDRIGNASAMPITVTTVSGVVLIDGAAIYTMNTDYQSINVIWNGASYEAY